VFAVDTNQRIVSTTPIAQTILGIRTTDTRPCYEVMRAFDQRNAAQCRPDCAEVTAARKGRIPQGSALWEPGCPRARSVATLVEHRQGAPSLIIHVLSDVGPGGTARPDSAGGEGLTDRQVEVLRLLAQGVPPPEIARLLNVRPVTVRNHIQTAMERLGAHSRLEAVMIGSRTGLL
jgi:DNA-binding CsgD family transcriptional regulator